MMDSIGVSENTKSHYGDWPNSQGFDVTYEERSPVELKVEGIIPEFAAGTLFRTGLGIRNIEAENGKHFRTCHWFDNLALVHRFQIHPPIARDGKVRVTYNSRSTCDGLIANIRATGRREGVTFGAKYDPCMSLFQKVSSEFKPVTPPSTPPSKAAPPIQIRQTPKKPDELSVAVTITANYPGLTREGAKLEGGFAKGDIQTLCNKTDSDAIQLLDPETLEPIGVASQATLHPSLKGPSSATHSSVDPNGDVYNYNLEFVKGQGIYRVFHVSASTGETSILATITDDPAYIHSMLLTENYAILCVWNSLYAYGGASILWTKNIVDAIAQYEPERSCKWYVVDRKPVEKGGRGLVATYESDPFFCFHTINAYEEVDDEGRLNIIADLVAYEDLDILKRLYIDNLLSDSATAPTFSNMRNCKSQLRRFTLYDIGAQEKDVFGRFDHEELGVFEATSEFIASKDLTPELPTINPKVSLKKYRFVYGVQHTGKSTFFDSIVKYDVINRTAKTWSRHGHTPGEPIFVEDPAGSEEDEDAGILLSVVLDGFKGKSYLLVLDARDLEEIGKAHVDGVIGFGFHGSHVAR